MKSNEELLLKAMREPPLAEKVKEKEIDNWTNQLKEEWSYLPRTILDSILFSLSTQARLGNLDNEKIEDLYNDFLIQRNDERHRLVEATHKFNNLKRKTDVDKNNAEFIGVVESISDFQVRLDLLNQICDKLQTALELNEIVQEFNRRKAVGEQIKTLRQAKGLTQANLAKKAGINRASLSLLENGERGFSFDLAIRMARALNISLDELFREYLTA